MSAVTVADGATCELTALEAARAIRAGEFTAESYAAALLAHHREIAELNIFTSKDDAALLASARSIDLRRRRGEALGSLAGVPLLVKDNIATSGLATTAGTPSLFGNRPSSNAPAVERLLAADALLFGKTNMDELGMGATSANASFGAVRNPYAADRIPGGSSGGTAAGVAARVAPAGLGTDTVGSGRIPASLCGVVGFRPSLERYPAGGIVPVSHTRDVVAPIARTVAEVELLDGIVSGRPPAPSVRSLRGVRLGLPRAYFWRSLAADVGAVSERAIALLSDAGCEFVEVEVPELAGSLERVRPILAFEAIADLREYVSRTHPSLAFGDVLDAIRRPDVSAAYRAFLDAAPTNAAYLHARDVERPRLRSLFAAVFRSHGVDALVYPSTPITAPRIGEEEIELDGVRAAVVATLARNVDPAAAAGLPAISIPAGLTEAGLPLGIEALAPAAADARLLALGAAIERSLPRVVAP